jgi:hypothetical protein
LRIAILKDMLLCMRTTVDLPESLMNRVKSCLAQRKMSFRALVISALEEALEEESKPFKLRDASAGQPSGERVSSEAINRAIDEQRNQAFGT